MYVSAVKVTHINDVALATPISLPEHNRSSLPISYEEIKSEARTANGTLRKFVIAKKKNIELSWNMLPSRADLVVDYPSVTGVVGAEGIQDLYNLHSSNKLTLALRYHSAPGVSSDSSAPMSSVNVDTVNVFISSFQYNIVKRLNDKIGASPSGFDYVDVSIGFTEV